MIIDCHDEKTRKVWHGASVKCNGKYIPYVVYADDERGIVLQIALDDNRQAILDQNKDFLYRKHRGEVEIILNKD